jgi:arsenate reductase-like glutaredoxin family protein
MTPAQYNEYRRQYEVIEQAKKWKEKQMTDKIVQQVIDKFNQRSEVGIKKYGTTLEQNNNDDFLNHLQEELMDAILYIEKLKSINQLS